MLWEDTEDEAPLPLVPSSSDGKVAEALLQHKDLRLLERYTELGQLLRLVWQRWLRWWWSLGEDDLFSAEILLNVILCSCLRSSGLFLKTAVRLLARLLMSLLSYLLMEWRNTVSLLFLFTSCTQDCRTGTEERRNINGVILIIELGDKVGFLQHLQALSLSFVTN